MNINPSLSQLDHSVEPGDNCDMFGNVLPVYASSDPGTRVDQTLTSYPTPQAVTVDNGLSRGPVGPALPAPAAPQPAADSVGKAQFMKRIASDVGVARKIAAAKVLEGDRKERLKKNEAVLHPEIRAARLRNLAASTNSFEELGEIHRMLAEGETEDVKHITDAAIRLAWLDVEPSRAACIELLETAIAVADRIAGEVQADEAELFAKYDMKRETTSLSRKIAAVKADLQRTLGAVRGDDRNPNVPIMHIRHSPTGAEFLHVFNLFEV